ncbi:uncharacterized protein LOC113464326 [Ceratina calcarata]|uniref:Uncharacterized protein LOC113464326 n=1 Tax=Ceratina calcarata TaxID=156304 RepID=A0AAJ7S1W2_9HYME|nr:uncharacterized protein LOC113464326 [Ceratina calcarata]
MSSSRRAMADRFTDCPGPCNPRNKVCRRTCVQNVLSILEELPPCIRQRLCQEDLLSVFLKDTDGEDGNLQQELDGTDTQRGRKELPAGSQRLDDCSLTPGGRPTQGVGVTQTMEEKQVQTTVDESALCELSSGFSTVQMGPTTVTTGFRQRTERASIVIRSIATRGAHMLEGRMPQCCCRVVNTGIYIGILFFLALFARNSPTYQIFLSSQICGILAIISWRISGVVPL